MFKNKFFGFATIAAILLTFIMVLVQIPVAKSAPKNLPVAIVNEDQGAMGKKVVQQIKKASAKNSTSDQVLAWSTVTSEGKLKQAMNRQHYYGAIVIPKNFSKSIKQLATAPKASPAELKVVINQEKNPTLATTVQTILTKIVDGVGTGVRGQITAQLATQNVPVPAAMVNELATPVVAKVSHTHQYKKLASTSAVFFQPIWLASLVASLMLHYAGTKSKRWASMTHVAVDKLWQVIGGGVIAAIIGFATSGYVYWILDYHFDHFMAIGSFLSIASFAFIMLFIGFISWIGFPAIVLFALLLFFSVPLMTMAPQLLPAFYQDWILPWLPMRFLYDGTRSMLYYNASLWNSATISLLIVTAVGFTVFVLEMFSPLKKKYIGKSVPIGD